MRCVVLCAAARGARRSRHRARQADRRRLQGARSPSSRKVTGKDRRAARMLLARAQIATGDYAAAEATITPIAQRQGPRPVAVDAHLVLDRVARSHRSRRRRAQGSRDSSSRIIRTIARCARRSARSAHDQGDVARRQGDVRHHDPRVRRQEARSRRARSALRARRGGAVHGAVRARERLVSRRAQAPAAADRGGHRVGRPVPRRSTPRELAEQTLERGVQDQPERARRARRDGRRRSPRPRYDLAAVQHHLEAALAVNPQARARAQRSRVARDRSATSGTSRTRRSIRCSRSTREDVEAIAMKATVAWLRDDTKAYEAQRSKALAIDPAYAELYRIVARSAVREHRYVEAIELEKEAIKLKPDFYEAMAGAGLGYLRLGMEKEGLDVARQGVQAATATTSAPSTRSTCSSRRSRRNTRSRRRRTSRSGFTTTRSPRSRATSSRRWSARSPTWCKRYGFTPKTPVVARALRRQDRLRGAHRRACRISPRSACASAR